VLRFSLRWAFHCLAEFFRSLLDRDQSSCKTLMRNGMSRDFSWGASAREYGKIYERARQARASAAAAGKS
jgi:glycogen synthase